MTRTESKPDLKLSTHGVYCDFGEIWPRHDTVLTISQADGYIVENCEHKPNKCGTFTDYVALSISMWRQDSRHLAVNMFM